MLHHQMSPTRTLIVAEARSWIGTPYQHQASLKGVGCDCLGLVRGVWRAVIGEEPERVPPYAPDWAEASGQESLAEAAARHLIPIMLTTASSDQVERPQVRSSSPKRGPRLDSRFRGNERTELCINSNGVDAGEEGWGPGDVLLFRWRAGLPAKHAAIATASDRMVHAHGGASVAEVFIAPWWRRHLAYAFVFPVASE